MQEMKQIKNFTTQDYLTMSLYTGCYMILGMFFFRRLLQGEHLSACLMALGCAGWVIIYLRFMKEIHKKNE